jgi:hypothetical protein
MIKLLMLLLIILSSCSIHTYTRGDILLPSYVHNDTLVVVIPFTLPDTIASDGDINEYISKRTVLYKQN